MLGEIKFSFFILCTRKKKYFVRELRETDLMELILRAALLQLYYGKSEGGMLHYSSQMKMNAFRYLVGFRKTNQSMFHLVHNAELEYNTNTNDGGRWVYTTSIGNCRWNEMKVFCFLFLFLFLFLIHFSRIFTSPVSGSKWMDYCEWSMPGGNGNLVSFWLRGKKIKFREERRFFFKIGGKQSKVSFLFEIKIYFLCTLSTLK